MSYEYRQDEGLDFLEEVPSEDLHDLVQFLLGDRNEELSETEGFKAHCPDHNKYWREIATEIQTFGGNTFSNLYRGEGTTYREILYDVCDRMDVNYNRGSSIQGIELNLLSKALADTVKDLEPEEKNKLIKELGEDNASIISGGVTAATAQILLRASGFAAYKWSLILVNRIFGLTLGTVLGKGLPLAANAALTRGLGVALGPIGLAITGVWTAYDFAGTAYRVTVPAVLYVAALRLKLSLKQD